MTETVENTIIVRFGFRLILLRKHGSPRREAAQPSRAAPSTFWPRHAPASGHPWVGAQRHSGPSPHGPWETEPRFGKRAATRPGRRGAPSGAALRAGPASRCSRRAGLPEGPTLVVPSGPDRRAVLVRPFRGQRPV